MYKSMGHFAFFLFLNNLDPTSEKLRVCLLLSYY